MKKIEQHKIKCSDWFESLRNSICKEIERLEESQCKFSKKKWLRDPKGSKGMGGGEMSLLRGKTFEKAGVNISTVYGKISKQLKKAGGEVCIEAVVPLATMLEYSTVLRAMTSGEGEFDMEFSHYEPVPPAIQQALTTRQ